MPIAMMIHVSLAIFIVSASPVQFRVSWVCSSIGRSNIPPLFLHCTAILAIETLLITEGGLKTTEGPSSANWLSEALVRTTGEIRICSTSFGDVEEGSASPVQRGSTRTVGMVVEIRR